MAGTKKEAEIEKVEEEQAKPKIRIAEQVKPKVVPEVKSDWAEKIRELLAGDIKPKANGGVRLNSSKYTPNSSVGSPAETVVKPASSTENVTPAPEKSRYRGWEGRLASPSRTTIAPANSKPGSEKKQSATPATPILAPTKSNATVEKKQFTSPPNTTAKTSQKTHITSPPTPTTTSTKHNPTFEKKRIFPPLLPTIHTTEIFTPRQVKQQSTSPPTTTSSQKQPLQPRKDQDKTKSGPNPSSKMSYQNAPVIPLRTALIAARVAAAAKAKHAAGREGKLPHMDKCKQVVGAKAGVV
ncbi:hypothetical protein L873DRAFT_1792237 [Choiromyces venosus 120613-1]|uniref:Uncharacterized protein n=1 Tax=Choiromyces venosus 120613-1 TaxID=1336337 RepID=A0A3N4JES7_9PEZI|nr:hypothetical protein L873DRAFT_1792237 [Choiromyces venosus 120613-1]